MKKLLLLAIIWASWTPLSHAQMRLGSDTIVAFATLEEGKRVLTAQDDFIRRMSPFDRAARMKTDRDVGQEDFLLFVGRNVLAWNEAEKDKVTSAFRGIEAKLEVLALPFPEKVLLIKTTGREEGGAAYTRANAVVFPESNLRAPVSRIQRTLCHELFHIISRADPDLREKLYAAIGFVKCDEVAFPSALKSRKITNPDAPRNDHCIGLKVEGRDCWAIPILYSRTEKYDLQQGDAFFNYLQFKLLLVQRQDGSPGVTPIYDGPEPKCVDVQETSGFFEQIGRNTRYIIHPEETLAENFVLVVLPQPNVPSPAIIEKLERIMKDHRDAQTPI